jgi:acyl-CoA thioesterase I
LAALPLLGLMIGCAEAERNLDAERAPPTARDVSGTATAGPTPAAAERVVLFVGTSLTAGYGLPREESFPTLVDRKIEEAGLPFRAVNAGVSGETSAGARRRIEWLVQQPFDVLVLETGANDMLRGTDPGTTEENIQAIVDRVRQHRPDAHIVLAGMLAMPNLGPDYARRFEGIYPRLAERNDLTLVPFLLRGVAAERHLNLADGIHPNAEGQRVIAETVWEVLEPVLRAEAGLGE